MRIGIMLRSLDEKGGIGIYTHNLVKELLAIDQKNTYILLYRNRANVGRFSHYTNVAERVVWGPNKACWDQLGIPYACWQEKVDVVLNPKFTAPLFAPCKAVMVVHGADWFIPEQAQFYSRIDVRYIKTMMPFYFKKCSAVISVSQLTTDNFYRVLKLPPGKLHTVYFAPARHFKRIEDETILRDVRVRYHLPQNFIFTLTKHGRGGDYRKNFGRILQAYARYHRQVSEPHKLVVGGKDCHLFREEYRIPHDGYGQDILFPGWIEQDDLPAIYSMADLYVYPSNLEAFPIPVVEAMACGTPLITSNANGLEEIAGHAALLVNPDDVDDIAQAMYRVITDTKFQSDLSVRGLARSKKFNWDSCACKTLEILEQVHANGQGTLRTHKKAF